MKSTGIILGVVIVLLAASPVLAMQGGQYSGPISGSVSDRAGHSAAFGGSYTGSLGSGTYNGPPDFAKYQYTGPIEGTFSANGISGTYSGTFSGDGFHGSFNGSGVATSSGGTVAGTVAAPGGGAVIGIAGTPGGGAVVGAAEPLVALVVGLGLLTASCVRRRAASAWPHAAGASDRRVRRSG